jgi:hypothetical protein
MTWLEFAGVFKQRRLRVAYTQHFNNLKLFDGLDTSLAIAPRSISGDAQS